MRLRFTILFLLVSLSSSVSIANQFLISIQNNSFDGNDPKNSSLVAGDTIYFESGIRGFVSIKNVKGSPEKPIYIFVKGFTEINTTHYYGISIQNCQYIIFNTQFEGTQGLRIVSPKGVGIGIGLGSSDYELAYISIDSTSGAGILAKSDPDCNGNYTRDKFISKNIKLHHLNILNTGTEGIYFGSTFYTGQTIQCNGKDSLMYPHINQQVEIYNCHIYRSGWDGIQVSSTIGADVHDNVIVEDSRQRLDNQMNGIIIGTGTSGKFYNHHIINGSGSGIQSFASDTLLIFNNIIYGAGSDNIVRGGRYGIYIDDKNMKDGSPIYVVYNSILHFRDEGIRLIAKNTMSTYTIQQNILSYYNSPKSDFIIVQGNTSSTSVNNNLYSKALDSLKLDTSQLKAIRITSESPCINKSFVINQSPFRKDIYGNPRPSNNLADWGAEEFVGITGIVNEKDSHKVFYGKDFIRIKSQKPILQIEVFDALGRECTHLFEIIRDDDGLKLYSNKSHKDVYIVQLNKERYKISL
jgi:hypothetical protein